MEKIKEIGDCNDVRCKQNSIKRINKKTCVNNCKYCKPLMVKGEKREYMKKFCTLGYWYNNKVKPM